MTPNCDSPNPPSAIRITIDAPDEEALAEVVTELADTDAALIQIQENRREARDAVSIDTKALTQIQRETISLAYEAGYYNPQREIRLGELAEDLELSATAISQRLRSGERNLVQAVMYGAPCCESRVPESEPADTPQG